MDTLKRHLPISGPEGLHKLRKIVERFEEKIYSAARSQIALGGRDRVVCQHLDLDDVVPRPHWMMLCTHECLFSMQADGPRFDERSCEGLVATQAYSRRHAD
ncbi:hypothetical protein CK203_113632 [Vitis vinifera]|uniref:Mediator complex subunit 15 KIX domain-containing protein n=1 Tax=Vitis vinifera TaxID=29760 RepID=A0A438C566_VITVI|nr:hypothetical protein CK203_113632 [Vitis vinifera]